jgi:hypothetical protein
MTRKSIDQVHFGLNLQTNMENDTFEEGIIPLVLGIQRDP